jgi:hypothetical protein
MVKRGGGSAQLSSLLPSKLSEFCNDENNSVFRSAMEALSNSKKITLLTVTIFFLFAFFNLILDAPRTVFLIFKTGLLQKASKVEYTVNILY